MEHFLHLGSKETEKKGVGHTKAQNSDTVLFKIKLANDPVKNSLRQLGKSTVSSFKTSQWLLDKYSAIVLPFLAGTLDLGGIGLVWNPDWVPEELGQARCGLGHLSFIGTIHDLEMLEAIGVGVRSF
ncbi:hypothetical protein HG531_012897 [Fusarium graminearum]|nr:hypothetical protein HG531_012897 [Fusarium graminearum]